MGAWLVLWPLPLANNTVLPGRASQDPAQQAWFLALARWAVTTGHLSFRVDKIFFPTGFNVLDNGSASLLGLVAAPVTGLLGPVATYDLMLRIAFLASATAGYLALRRLRISWLAAASGGAIYGFSPYMTHESTYLFLAFVPLPPLMFLVVYEHLCVPSRPGRDNRWSTAVRRGVPLGLMAAAQFLISSEILDTTVLVLGSTLLVLGVAGLRHPTALAEHVKALGRLAAVTAVVAVALLAYPVWFALTGPEHITQLTAVARGPGIDWAHTLWPVDRRLVAGHLPSLGTSGPTHHNGDTALIGIPLLLVCAVTVALYRRRPLVRALTVVGGSAWILALGTRLVHRGLPSGIPLPFALLAHHVLFQDVVRPRLTLYVALGVAALCAIALDQSVRAMFAPASRPTAVLGLAGVVLVLFGMIYISPDARTPVAAVAPRPATTAQALALIPAGAVVLAYPFPDYPDDEAMLWQAQAGFRFSLVGGYAYQQDPGQSWLTTSAVTDLLTTAWAREPVSPQLAQDAARQLPELVARHGITVAMVELAPRSSPARPSADRGAGSVVRLFTAIYGPPDRLGPYDIWRFSQRTVGAAAPGRTP